MSKLENPRMKDENYQQKKYTMRKVTRQIYGLRNCSKKQNNQYEMMEYMATPYQLRSAWSRLPHCLFLVAACEVRTPKVLSMSF